MGQYHDFHDISHCDGKYCKMREKCRRYLAHLDIIKKGVDFYYTYVIIEEKDINSTGSCDMYWEN